MENRLAQVYDARAASMTGDFLAQVGHTLNGKPISQSQYEATVDHLVELLDLQPRDRVLDLCCGNGVYTHRLAGRAASVVGVDYSAGLIGVAREFHQPENVSYLHADVLALDGVPELQGAAFDKILMLGSLQHFGKGDFGPLLDQIARVRAGNGLIVIAFIPDAQKRRHFFNTPRRKLGWLMGKLRGVDIFGTWWRRDFIREACRAKGYKADCRTVDERLEVARYRFNALIA